MYIQRYLPAAMHIVRLLLPTMKRAQNSIRAMPKDLLYTGLAQPAVFNEIQLETRKWPSWLST